MSRLTARDYKKTARRSLDFSRYREFGAGMLLGVVVASGAFVYMRDPTPAVQDTESHRLGP